MKAVKCGHDSLTVSQIIQLKRKKKELSGHTCLSLFLSRLFSLLVPHTRDSLNLTLILIIHAGAKNWLTWKSSYFRNVISKPVVLLATLQKQILKNHLFLYPASSFIYIKILFVCNEILKFMTDLFIFLQQFFRQGG